MTAPNNVNQPAVKTHQSTIKVFRRIGILEGTSYLLLLGIAMPVKYLAGIPEPVKVIGWIHGLLFVLYVAALMLVAVKLRWNFLTILIGFIASLLPFGPFLFDRYFLRAQTSTR